MTTARRRRDFRSHASTSSRMDTMDIIQHKPVARGVNQLMYVGDDQATEGSYSLTLPVKVVIALAAAWLLFGKR